MYGKYFDPIDGTYKEIVINKIIFSDIPCVYIDEMSEFDRDYLTQGHLSNCELNAMLFEDLIRKRFFNISARFLIDVAKQNLIRYKPLPVI